MNTSGNPEQPIFPVAPTPDERTCVALGLGPTRQLTDTTGMPCTGCELYNQTDKCDVLDAGRFTVALVAELQTEHQLRLADNERSAARLIDSVIPGFRTGGGMEALIRAEEEVAREFLAGNWAMLFGDIRGVKETNDTVSLKAGDNLLYAAGLRLLQRNVGVRPLDSTPPATEQRDNPDTTDVGFRETGSDEVGIWVRNVSRTQALKVLERQTNRFSVQRAKYDDNIGELPITGTFVILHASDILPAYEAEIALADTHEKVSDLASHIFYDTLDQLRAREENLKTGQYAAMWSDVVNTLNAQGLPLPPYPGDERAIAKQFREVCTPGYSADRRNILQQAGPHMQQNGDQH